MAALFLAREEYPERLLELAWREMVRNAAHDSICACSVDDVVDAVLHRYGEARDIAAGLADRALSSFARSLSQPGPTVLNPAARPRSGVIEVVVPADGPAPVEVQVLSERAGLPGSMVFDANTVRTVLGMLQGPRISDDAWVHDVRIEDTEEGIDITVAIGQRRSRVCRSPRPSRTSTPGGSQSRCGRPGGHGPACDAPSRGPHPMVPGYGWSAFEAAPLANPVEVADEDALVVSNGLVRVEVDRATGTFALDGLAGDGRLVDGGDLGDSYNYSPPGADSLVDSPEGVIVQRRRTRSGSRPGPHQGNLCLAGPRRRFVTGPGRGESGRGRDQARGTGRRIRGAGDHEFCQPQR